MKLVIHLHARGVVAIVALACALSACGSDDDGAPPAPVAVLSAFPAELAPLLGAATIRETRTIDGHEFHLGELGGVEVVLGMTGIGLVNAAATTRTLLDNFEVRGIVVAGVAGASLRIGDVAVARTWTLDGASYAADDGWLDTAAEVAADAAAVVDTCTVRPMAPSEGPVCLAHVPGIAVGGTGASSDTFGPMGFRCRAGGGDVFGCEVAEAEPAFAPVSASVLGDVDAAAITVEDQETAAIAREATARGVRFIAFRSVSDGSGDPLDLPGFPAQFFAYYRLAARNAAGAAIAFLEGLGGNRDERRSDPD